MSFPPGGECGACLVRRPSYTSTLIFTHHKSPPANCQQIQQQKQQQQDLIQGAAAAQQSADDSVITLLFERSVIKNKDTSEILQLQVRESDKGIVVRRLFVLKSFVFF